MNKILYFIPIILTLGACSSNVKVNKPDFYPVSDEPPVSRIEVRNSVELLEALENPQPGDYIFVHTGTYKLSERIFINESGTPDELISLIGDLSGDRPVFDYSSMEENSSNQGMVLKGNYWHIKGIRFYNAGDNGLHIRGSNNIIEYCDFYENSDSGLQLDDGAAENLILNCDSYHNADLKIENADGFAVKMDVGDGNRFVGCRAWNNLDDGWDGYLREADNISTTYEFCWAFNNGFLKDGTQGKGDGNGFKTGGSDNKLRKHNAVYIRCIAAGNVNDGFDHNSNRGKVQLLNCAAYDNGRNLSFSDDNNLDSLVVKNTVVFGDPGKYKARNTSISHNSWQNGLQQENFNFRSFDINELSKPRKEDGSLPDVSFLFPAKESTLIDEGEDVGLPYYGKAPDIGAFEYNPKTNKK